MKPRHAIIARATSGPGHFAPWLGVLLWLPLLLSAGSVPDYQIRALYLFNFSNFVAWPDTAGDGVDTFDYCMVARGRVEKTLASLIDGERRDGRPLRLRRVTARAEDLRGCRVLYLRGIERDHLDVWLRLAARRPLLTVADDADFARHGGMVALVREGRKIRMYIDLDRARESGLRMNARLLQLARIVGPGD